MCDQQFSGGSIKIFARKSNNDTTGNGTGDIQGIIKRLDYLQTLGIDGLRLDVVNLISKPEQFEDDFEGDGRRFYTDGPKIHQYLQMLNQNALTPYGLMTVGEMSSTN